MVSRSISAARRVVSGPNKPALIVSLLVSLFAALFVTSYSLAMSDPQPHDVPIGVVSPGVTPEQLDQALESVTTTSFDVEPFATEAEAKNALEEQQIYAVLVTDATAGSSTTAQLFISSASGASIARIIEAEADQIGQKLGITVTVTDLNPLSPNDPSGLVLFYLALASTIIGFVGAIQTRVNAGGLTLAGELAWDAGRAALVGLVITLTTGPIFGFETFPFFPVWGVLSVAVFIAGAVYSFFRVVIGGKWALVPTWILFILISNPSSGGAVAPELLPPFYEFMGRWLPTGATVRALRDLTYFPEAPHAEPYLVLGAWLVLSTAGFVVARRIKFGAGRLDRVETVKPDAGGADARTAESEKDGAAAG
ncbi:ABC transporter permease [Herbiconiux sp. KACC 21604]|uniref:ABC transporter permease n=1 Tax=unclassified Herbiconiux TaxID=2618217 RepID=UPI001491199E|nr:ABC transporter permease [Herbiconiux sp. SALV-R1]QJU52304.1 ABC transporter permease [Herbiconiux sp. SALV-R1]WPO87152.1 ABC transporter permease [Herbiconiux sp. KACC 21604]